MISACRRSCSYSVCEQTPEIVRRPFGRPRLILVERLLMNENMSHTLRGPENEEEWRVYHAIRHKLF
jgi:hypothetical protein